MNRFLLGSLEKIPTQFLRNLPNWPNAPVPCCMGGDYRALSFCCKPGYSLTFGQKCLRDQKLAEIGLTPEEFIQIKDNFSKIHEWDGDSCCFGSLSYCCMRQSGCPRRDADLNSRYPEKSKSEWMGEYFALKRELAQLILMRAKKKEKVAHLIEP